MHVSRRSFIALSAAVATGAFIGPAQAEFSLFGLFGGNRFPTEPVSVDAAAAAKALSDFRKLNRLAGVAVNSGLMAIAATQAKAMAEAGSMSHDVAGSFESRLASGHYATSAAAENIAAGQKTFAEVFTGWQNSPHHRENMLLPAVTQIGIAAYRGTGSKFGIYWSLALAAAKL